MGYHKSDLGRPLNRPSATLLEQRQKALRFNHRTDETRCFVLAHNVPHSEPVDAVDNPTPQSRSPPSWLVDRPRKEEYKEAEEHGRNR